MDVITFDEKQAKSIAQNIWNKFKEAITEEIDAYIEDDRLPVEESLWESVYVDDDTNSEFNLVQAVYIIKLSLGEPTGTHVEGLIGDLINDEVSYRLKNDLAI